MDGSRKVVIFDQLDILSLHREEGQDLNSSRYSWDPCPQFGTRNKILQKQKAASANGRPASFRGQDCHFPHHRIIADTGDRIRIGSTEALF